METRTQPPAQHLDLDSAPLPVWVYALHANAFRWANREALAFWRVESVAAFRAIDLSDIRAVTRARLYAVARRLEAEPQVTESWTLYPGGDPRTVVCTIWPVDWDGERCFAIMALPMLASETQDELRLRDRILNAVAKSAERLLGGGDWAAERDALLAELGRATQVDRCYYFHFDEPGESAAEGRLWTASQISEWCADGVPPEIGNPEMQGFDMQAYCPHWAARLAAGLPVVAAGPEQIPQEEWSVVAPQGVTAICLQPVLIDRRPVGFIGFDIVGAAHPGRFAGWTAPVVDALATAAHLIAAALQMARTRRQLYQALTEACNASAAKSNFLANMSHELRTPLNAIIGFAELIETEVLGQVGDERYRVYASDIRQSGRHLLGLIGDVLDLARAEAGRIELDEAPCELESDIVGPSLSLLSGRARTAGLRLTGRMHAPRQRLNADARKLVQVITNLLTNAVKFSDPDSEVTLDTEVGPDGSLLIRVSDSGPGMTEAEAAKALEPFTQVGDQRPRHQEGSGLGLPLARQLAELHGGRLTVDSCKGRGTTVTVALPADRLLAPTDAPPALG